MILEDSVHSNTNKQSNKDVRNEQCRLKPHWVLDSLASHLLSKLFQTNLRISLFPVPDFVCIADDTLYLDLGGLFAGFECELCIITVCAPVVASAVGFCSSDVHPVDWVVNRIYRFKGRDLCEGDIRGDNGYANA